MQFCDKGTLPKRPSPDKGAADILLSPELLNTWIFTTVRRRGLPGAGRTATAGLSMATKGKPFRAR